MSDHSLPKTLDPFKYADQRKELEGEIALQLMPRLTDMLVDDKGSVSVKLDFGRDEQNLRVINGELNATVNIVCQRCLKPVEKSIHSTFALGLILSDEQAMHLPKVYEPLLVQEEKIVLLDVIEEELILSLPMFAYHDACDANEFSNEDGEIKSDDNGEKAENPFSVLAGLKLKK